MAAFMIGKSLKDRRQTKAIEELFDKADKNGNGKISVEEYVHIFSEHGIQLSPEEVEKVCSNIMIQWSDRVFGTYLHTLSYNTKFDISTQIGAADSHNSGFP